MCGSMVDIQSAAAEIRFGKKLVKQQYFLHRSWQYGKLRPTNSWDRLTSLGHPCKFQLVSHLGSITARHLVVGVSQTLRRWTEGATYIQQGDHHVGHWPTFLVLHYFLQNCLVNNFYRGKFGSIVPAEIWTVTVSCVTVSSVQEIQFWQMSRDIKTTSEKITLTFDIKTV